MLGQPNTLGENDVKTAMFLSSENGGLKTFDAATMHYLPMSEDDYDPR